MEQMEQLESELESQEMLCFKDQLQEIVKPYQQELNRNQKKSDFLAKCIRCIEKNDFFQLDELLRSKQANDILKDPSFTSCDSIFDQLQKFAETQINNYQIQFRGTLLQLAEEIGLPLEVTFPGFSVLKGIEGKLDFSTRSTIINQTVLKSMDPKRIIAALLNLKRTLYDSPFEPQTFIDSLFECYKAIIKREGDGINEVPIQQLYTEYVWSLQSKTFFQNMDKARFKGYSVEQFAVHLWRFFESHVSTTDGGYRIKLNPGRAKSLWLLDQFGEKRQITHASFIKD